MKKIGLVIFAILAFGVIIILVAVEIIELAIGAILLVIAALILWGLFKWAKDKIED